MKKLPPRVYFKHGSYYFVDDNKKWLKLGKNESDVYQSLAKIKSASVIKMDFYFNDYYKNETVNKALTTQSNEIYVINKLIKHLGHYEPLELTTPLVYNWHKERSRVSKSTADREKALLSCVFHILLMQGVVDSNPCAGVKKNGTKPRERYVTDDEFFLVKNHAKPSVQRAMTLALLTGLRLGDILRLNRGDVKEDGLHCRTGKTGRSIVFLWSDALLSECIDSPTFYLVSTNKGSAYSASGFKSVWQRLMVSVVALEKIERFQFRDLRTKAACDISGDASRLLGHSSDRITKKFYEIKPWEVKPVY